MNEVKKIKACVNLYYLKFILNNFCLIFCLIIFFHNQNYQVVQLYVKLNIFKLFLHSFFHRFFEIFILCAKVFVVLLVKFQHFKISNCIIFKIHFDRFRIYKLFYILHVNILFNYWIKWPNMQLIFYRLIQQIKALLE